MGNETTKATITIGNKTVTFEGPQEFVQAQVALYVNAPISSRNQATDIKASKPQAPQSEREIIELKRPRNHSETVAVLGFCLAQSGMEEFSEADIRRAYIRAGVRPPKVVSQAIRDAKNNCDYVETGSRRGFYKLTNHGDRTVRFDMPFQD